MASAYNGASLSLVGVLLQLGANINAEDQAHRKASAWAKEGHHDQIATFLDNIMVIPALCCAYIPRLGKESKLPMLPIDVIRLVRDALALSSNTNVSRKRRHT
jgi:hypothetical protein